MDPRPPAQDRRFGPFRRFEIGLDVAYTVQRYGNDRTLEDDSRPDELGPANATGGYRSGNVRDPEFFLSLFFV